MEYEDEEFKKIVYKGIEVPLKFRNERYYYGKCQKAFSTVQKATEDFKEQLEEEVRKQYTRALNIIKKDTTISIKVRSLRYHKKAKEYKEWLML